jgi:predicted glutamine amidotransferase
MNFYWVWILFVACLSFCFNSILFVTYRHIHMYQSTQAYYQGRGLRQFHDVEAASTSPLAQFLGSQSIRTRNMLAHIRYATSGEVNLANVHPFSREMWGIQWCFCHNGHVPLYDHHHHHNNRTAMDLSHIRLDDSPPVEPIYFPVGTTDSEAVFCALLNALRARFTDAMPSLPVLYDALQQLCRQIVQYDPPGTILNFLLACGPHVLWVYSWPGRRPGSTTWNGLHYTVRGRSTVIRDGDYTLDITIPSSSSSSTSRVNGDRDLNHHNVCIVATAPLTQDEEWMELQRGELLLMDNGRPHVSHRDLFRVELQGHGLEGQRLPPPRLEEDMRRYQLDPSFFVADGI